MKVRQIIARLRRCLATYEGLLDIAAATVRELRVVVEHGDDNPIEARDLLEKYSVDELNAFAEGYFARIPSWDYHLAKPLGSPSSGARCTRWTSRRRRSAWGKRSSPASRSPGSSIRRPFCVSTAAVFRWLMQPSTAAVRIPVEVHA